MADQITDMILCSLSYFVPGEQLAEMEIPEVRRKVRVQPLLTSHRQNQEHSAFRWEATWAVSMSPSLWRNKVTMARCPETATVKDKPQPKENGTRVRLLTSLATALPLRQVGPKNCVIKPVCDCMCIALVTDSTHTHTIQVLSSNSTSRK